MSAQSGESRQPIGGIVGLLMGDSVLISGVEDDPEDGLLRVYIGPRYEWRYVLVSDPDEQKKVRQAWGSSMHLTTARPDHYYVDDDALAAMKARQQSALSGSSALEATA